jgi:Protein of unknown function (DUF4235)
MRLLFKPFEILGRMISKRIGRSLFTSVWTRIDPAEPPPNPIAGRSSTAKVVAAHALEAGIMAGVTAAGDRVSARFFHHLIGIWPAKPTRYETEDEE